MTPKKKKVVKRVAGQPKTPRANRVHKVITVICSVGDEDRDRSFADFEKSVKDALAKAGTRNITRTGGYYIVDGKVCLEQDYDLDVQNFKEGSTPPPWAGGPMGNAAVERSTGGEQKGVMPEPTKPRTPTEAMRDLRENTDWGKKNSQRLKDDARARKVAEVSDDDLEWDEDDALDDDKMGEVADKNAKKAISKLKNSKKIVVKKKTGDVAPPKTTAKKVVRRKK